MADVTTSRPHSYPAPAALVEHCTRARKRTTSPNVPNAGSHDIGDVAALVTWLHERDEFASHDPWVSLGMALKLEFSDAGKDVWELTRTDATDDVIDAKWDSFASEPDNNSVTLSTWLKRAHTLGWKGTIRKSTGAMFDGVAQIAQAAGASLAGSGALPMLAGQEELARVGEPILTEFIENTRDAPNRPLNGDYPTLPESVSGHGLYTPLQDAIARVLAMAEAGTPKWKSSRVADALAVLSLVHQDTYDAVVRRIRTIGVTLLESKIKLAAAAISDRVERAFVSQDGWIYDPRSGLPEPDNSDNVAIFLAILGLEIRWNAWLERAEVRGGNDPALRFSDWTYLDDTIIALLRTRGNRTKTRFRPGKEFFYESLLSLAHANVIDPALDRLLLLEKEWDGVPRLSIWMSKACHVPCDLYHQSVARNIVGGIVRRIRHPGCKHDTMPVFFGPQGPGKSTMAAILADMGQSSLGAIIDSGGKWFTDTILLGDQAKELVLSLAGKCVAEIAEMGMRGAANPNHVKAMISRQVDAGRTAYARSVSERQRRNVFIGTANDDDPLTDPTGNRRFLPVRIDVEIDLVWLHQHVGLLIGEAAYRESRGASFDLPREVWAAAAEHQEAARSESDIETLLTDWFAPTSHSQVAYITAADLVALTSGWRSLHGGRTPIMKRLGFRSELVAMSGKRTRVWVRAPEELAPGEVIRTGVRYMVSESGGRMTVTIRTNPNIS
jgi:hypothetical protein